MFKKDRKKLPNAEKIMKKKIWISSPKEKLLKRIKCDVKKSLGVVRF